MDYYNEWDRFAAAWLRELIADGHLPQGIVDERDIRTVKPEDLKGYRQAHFFAGIGGWPLALKLAGWPEDRPVWTGSCPCQPFSVAGKAGGVGDERHLWPAFHRLIAERRPSVVFGEQVESKDGRYWLSGVRDDLERLGYAVGAADLCAAGVGAPHRRQRLYWVADRDDTRWARQEKSHEGRVKPSDREQLGQSLGARLEGHARNGDDGNEPGRDGTGKAGSTAEPGASCGMEHTSGKRADQPTTPEPSGDRTDDGVPRTGSSGRGGLADADGGKPGDGGIQRGGEHGQRQEDGEPCGMADSNGEQAHATNKGRLHAESAESSGDGRTNPWTDSRLILCRDGKHRRIPLEPALFPLAPRLPGRLGLLRGAGGSIVPQVAAEFIRAYLDEAH